ncbi:hypothetical protein EBT16_03430 [bacterium]|nr:hypothetical protein [bacterium]
MSPAVTTGGIKPPNFLQILDEVILVHGVREFRRLTQKEMELGVSDPAIIPELPEFWDRTKHDIDHTLRALTGSLSEGTQRSLSSNLKHLRDSLLKGVGFVFSWSITQRDIRFSAGKAMMNEVYLHRPMVVGVNILLGWFMEMLTLAGAHPSLSASDSTKILLFKTFILQFSEGFKQGVYRKELLIKFIQSIKLSKRRRDVHLRVDSRFLHWLETEIQRNQEF